MPLSSLVIAIALVFVASGNLFAHLRVKSLSYIQQKTQLVA
jgi:hypothetical protein